MSRPKKPLVYNNEHLAIARGFGVREFGEELEKVLVRESKVVTKERFSPSSLAYSGSCPRYHFYRFNGTFADYRNQTPEAIQNMEAGTSAGERIANVLKDAGMLVDAEVWVENVDPPIGGYIDALVNWKGEEIVCEVKTTRDNTWNYRSINDMVPGYQLLQLLIYMRLTNHDKGFLLTENKDNHKLFILPVRMNEKNTKLLDYVFDWMRKVKTSSDEGKLPKRGYPKATMECRGCEFKNVCWEGFEKAKKHSEEVDPNPGVVDLPNLEVPK